MLVAESLSMLEQAIQEAVGPARFDLWFKGNTHFTLEEESLQVGVPNRFFREWLERHFQAEIRASAEQVFGPGVTVRFHIDPALFQQNRQHQTERGAAAPPSAPAPRATSAPTPASAASKKSAGASRSTGQPFTLHVACQDVGTATPTPGKTLANAGIPLRRTSFAPPPARAAARASRFSLTRFLTGTSNRVAHAAALAMVDAPLSSFSPLLIHGGTGLGKTHLLKGIEEGLRERHRELKVVSYSCEEFTNEFVESMRGNRLNGFRRKVRHLDLLLVDDVQFLKGKRATQEEFFHTLDALSLRGGKVVLTADCHPMQMDKITEELRSRFVAGMVARLEPPDGGLRRQVLREKSAQRNLVLPVAVIEFLADHLRSNFRHLEGALNYLQHFAETMDAPLDVPMVRQALADVLRQSAPVISVGDVEQQACKLFHIEPKQLRERNRSRAVSHQRMFVLYLARKYTKASYSEIGRQIGGLNHSTVIAGEKKILDLLSKDSGIVLGDRQWRLRDALDSFDREMGATD